MSGFSNIIRGIVRAPASIAHAVQAGARKLDSAVQAQQAPAPVQPPTSPAEGAPASTGFVLPDLGPGPDANAAEYQGEQGKAAYEEALHTYQHKQDIHKAFTDLDRIFTEAHPGRDFQKEYQDEVAMLNQHEAERPKGSGLARAALALGEFNPAVQQSGRSPLNEYNARVEEAGAQSDKGFSQRLTLRMKMHEQAAAEAEQQGNWKKALAENEKAALLKADEDALKHTRAKDLENVKQTGATNRALIKRDAAERTAKIRASAVASGHGLTGGFKAQFEKEAARQMAKMLGPKDITKDYAPTDIDEFTNYLENFAEHLSELQTGKVEGPETHPTRRTKAKSKEAF